MSWRITIEFGAKRLLSRVMRHTISISFDMEDRGFRGGSDCQEPINCKSNLSVSFRMPDVLISTHFCQREAIGVESELRKEKMLSTHSRKLQRQSFRLKS